MVRTVRYSSFIVKMPFLNFKVTCLIICLFVLSLILNGEKLRLGIATLRVRIHFMEYFLHLG